MIGKFPRRMPIHEESAHQFLNRNRPPGCGHPKVPFFTVRDTPGALQGCRYAAHRHADPAGTAAPRSRPGCLEPPLGSDLEITRYASRNIFEAPIDARDDCLERARYRHVAEKYWQEACKHTPQAYTVDYHRGFVEGFADYVYAGPGAPPAVPPWPYRRAVYETPEGVRAVEDWFAGFRHGTQAAQASGLRNLVVVPTQLPPPPPLPQAPAQTTRTDELPTPRKLMPPASDGDQH